MFTMCFWHFDLPLGLRFFQCRVVTAPNSSASSFDGLDTRLSALRRQRPLDGPWLAEDDEQVGTCGAVGLGTALLPVLQRARVAAVPRGDGSLRGAARAPDRPDLVGSE